DTTAGLLLQFAGGLFKCLTRPGAEGDVDTLFGEFAGNGFADTSARPSDDCDFTGQVKIHSQRSLAQVSGYEKAFTQHVWSQEIPGKPVKNTAIALQAVARLAGAGHLVVLVREAHEQHLFAQTL